MTNPERAGSRSLDSINEVVLCDDIQTSLVLLHVLHELGQDNLVHLSFSILINF